MARKDGLAHSLIGETVALAACRSVSLKPTTLGAWKFQKIARLCGRARIRCGERLTFEIGEAQRALQATLPHLHARARRAKMRGKPTLARAPKRGRKPEGA